MEATDRRHLARGVSAGCGVLVVGAGFGDVRVGPVLAGLAGPFVGVVGVVGVVATAVADGLVIGARTVVVGEVVVVTELPPPLVVDPLPHPAAIAATPSAPITRPSDFPVTAGA